MKIVDTLVIAQDKSIMVIKVNNKYYLVSVSQSGIKLITEMENFDESNVEAVENSGNIYENIDFKSIFTQLTQMMPNKKNK